MRARIFISMAIIASAVSAGEILDRIAVTVGKQVITEGDVLNDLRVSAFIDRTALNLSGAEKRKAADRLVDQILILQEASFSRIPLPAQNDAAKMLADVRAQYSSQDEYEAAMKRYGVTEGEVANYLLAGYRALRFTDLRFRPEIEITDADVHDYYNTLVEQWRAKGETKIPTLEQSRDDVEKLLVVQRTSQALDRWLGSQRNQTQILYREQVFK